MSPAPDLAFATETDPGIWSKTVDDAGKRWYIEARGDGGAFAAFLLPGEDAPRKRAATFWGSWSTGVLAFRSLRFKTPGLAETLGYEIAAFFDVEAPTQRKPYAHEPEGGTA